jgi:hypothetical protein
MMLFLYITFLLRRTGNTLRDGFEKLDDNFEAPVSCDPLIARPDSMSRTLLLCVTINCFELLE